MTEDLYTLEYGDHGSRVAFCHGLFGQGRNWNHIARALAHDYRVTLVDLPDHGRSPWSNAVDYAAMADRVAALFDAEDPVALVGHSMGGKVVMTLALRHPEIVERLCVVDIAPIDYRSGSEFQRYVAAMRDLDLSTITTRDDAYAAMAHEVPDMGVRAFLLQNLRREGSGWRWQVNLDVLGRDLSVLASWPLEAMVKSPYEGPVLWVGGETSRYISDESVPAMREHFPRVQKVTIRGAGHWVHSDQPETFLDVLRAFLARPSQPQP